MKRGKDKTTKRVRLLWLFLLSGLTTSRSSSSVALDCVMCKRNNNSGKFVFVTVERVSCVVGRERELRVEKGGKKNLIHIQIFVGLRVL